ncbi:hypothetical protein GFO_1726 [Christiangramia forsetii KT0803]|uniref:Uncharacterized protein n=1 Tax=Christiangramia forsetii (strain DSM 17595 / CGMCC 1.15422 / KT0803) TaxID=411154 RepID=A0M251_CHRFK|nr:hypothetical protein GFO_1726 [Christiangramia forsetii KT0803]
MVKWIYSEEGKLGLAITNLYAIRFGWFLQE